MIRLLQNYYQSEQDRQLELLTTLTINKSLVDQLVILTECKLELTGAIIHYIESRPTFNDCFKHINNITGQYDINIIANADIAFDDTITLVNKLAPGHAYAITRQDALIRPETGPTCDSQDCWVFRGPISSMTADFPMGKLGCDNRLLWEIVNAGYIVDNPALDIHLHHNHSNKIRHYGLPIPGPYHYIGPQSLQ